MKLGRVTYYSEEYFFRWNHYPGQEPLDKSPVYVKTVGAATLGRKWCILWPIWRATEGEVFSVKEFPLWIPLNLYKISYPEKMIDEY